nr:hypothetical protein CFP56_20399 [Quercus suber]
MSAQPQKNQNHRPTGLLVLSDDLLMDVYDFLGPTDLHNLDLTCRRTRSITPFSYKSWCGAGFGRDSDWKARALEVEHHLQALD